MGRKALTKALPKMAKNASSEELVAALNEHVEVTKNQVSRLEQVFESLGKKAQAKKCDAMEGLIKEGEGIIEDTKEGPVRDAGIIGACQKVEHYEIATYGTLASFANLLGEAEAAELLEETLAEEKEADVTLTGIAESSINLDANEVKAHSLSVQGFFLKQNTMEELEKTIGIIMEYWIRCAAPNNFLS